MRKIASKIAKKSQIKQIKAKNFQFPPIYRQVEAPGEDVYISFNSNRGYVYIEGNGIMSVKLFSIEGRKMSNFGFKGEKSVTIDTTGIPRGVYLLAIITKNGQVCKKILITNN